ncbi:MAG: thymidine phosphorylase [Rhodobacteraceae bacterium]|nr:thymidine phosphorylase [Paracoccaceae bacterium]
MDARSIIASMRQKQEVSEEALRWFAQGLADQGISDAQAGAFAMAVCLNGLGETGRRALTLAMRDSGDVLSWDLPGPVIDKHSTGGVGDCVSLVLAPALAECGAYVPMISGRGLGHTGGTLDKMEAIPGVTTQVSEAHLQRIVAEVGCAIVGATGQIAPADKRLYAIRDVTATVESVDLITASILSKKLAAAPQALVLDVKVGSGAFMKSVTEARELAKALVSTANAAGCKTTALLSDMSQPLAPSLGNALEVAEVLKVLAGDAGGPLWELSVALGGQVLLDAGLVKTLEQGETQIANVLADGRAAERFGRMVYAVGGPIEFVEKGARFLPEAVVIREVTAAQSGYVASIDGEALGLAVVRLGGGRQVESDQVDPSVGLSGVVRLGARVEKGQPLAMVHAAREEHADQAAEALRNAITLSDQPLPGGLPLVMDRIVS